MSDRLLSSSVSLSNPGYWQYKGYFSALPSAPRQIEITHQGTVQYIPEAHHQLPEIRPLGDLKLLIRSQGLGQTSRSHHQLFP